MTVADYVRLVTKLIEMEAKLDIAITRVDGLTDRVVAMTKVVEDRNG